ncbi:MAG: acyltransferase family protein [Acetobacter sp.]
MAFRPDINGLRGIAVLAVVLFHVFPKISPGGFCGVDIFLVISGYLITAHVAHGLETGSFSWTDFYARRICRLAPALIVVLMAVAAAGAVCLLPMELADLGLDEAAGATFLSNILLWSQQGYFDRSAAVKPLLHLWSLGVEEQFYLLWPVVLVLAGASGLRRRRVVMVVGALSYVAGLACVALSPDFGFYWIMPRAWEFAAGALLTTGLPQGTQQARRVMAWAGLAVLVLSFILLRPSAMFPGLTAVFPVMGTCLLIAAGPSAGYVTRGLGAGPLQALGRISYPLYLWHWPLVAYTNIIHGVANTRNSIGLTVIGVSVGFAVLTEWLVERPVRGRASKKGTALVLLAALSGLALAGLITWHEKGWPGRYGTTATDMDLGKINLAERDGIFPCPEHMQVRNEGGLIIGIFGPELGNPIIFAGDSLLFQWTPRIETLFREHRLARTVIFVGGTTCDPFPGRTYDVKVRFCTRLPDTVLRLAVQHKATQVVIGANWDAFFTPSHPGFSENFRQAWHFLQSLSDNGARAVSLIDQTPVDERFSPATMVQRSFFHVSVNADAVRAGIPMADIRTLGPSRGPLEQLAKLTGAKLIDLTAEICGSATRCFPLMEDGTPKFADLAHLRPVFTRTHVHGLDSLVE